MIGSESREVSGNFPYLDARTQNVSNVATGAIAFETNGYYIFLEYYQNNSQLQ